MPEGALTPAAPRRRIRAQGSPADPHVMRFILDAPVQAGRTAEFEHADARAPLSTALFAVPGVARVQVAGETVSVTRDGGADWDALKPAVAGAIREALDATYEPLGAAPLRDPEADARMLAIVNDVLDQQANPQIASHGGRVTCEQVDEGRIYLRMSGGCQGCASSARTLRQGVETILRNTVPGVREIIDVTDHAAGTNPFYRRDSGQSALYRRPLPPDAIEWDDGRLVIDPDFLAPRLDLTPESLQDGLARGEVIISKMPRPGQGAAGARVIVRSTRRAWAADIAPDGTGEEVPPPKPLTQAEVSAGALHNRVRDYLMALPPAQLPLTYGRLARALGMYLPGSVGRVTAALEASMQADAQAGRPFVAARVIGKGPGQIPGKGYFDLARKLGRGPEPGESDQAWHRRHLIESLGIHQPEMATATGDGAA